MTKEQFKKAKELRMLELFTGDTLDALRMAKEGRKAHLKLIVEDDAHYKLDSSALEAALEVLLPMYEERLNQIQKKFNEL